MKVRILFFAITQFCLACRSVPSTQVFLTNIAHQKPKLSRQEYVAIIQPSDTSIIDNTYLVGWIKPSLYNKKSMLSYSSLLIAYDSIAKQNGANAIRLLNIHYSQKANEPDRVTAILYRVPDIRIYEKKIIWTPTRRLSWDDFKGVIPDSLIDENRFSSYASIGIQHRSNASFLVGTDRFFVLSTFDCNKSWYRPYAYYQTNFLEFQQSLFDLTELYARKMRQQLNTKKVKDKNTFTANVDKDLSQQYKDAESKFVMETKGGSDLTALKEWHEKIWRELVPY